MSFESTISVVGFSIAAPLRKKSEASISLRGGCFNLLRGVTGVVSRRKNQGATLHNDLQGNWCTSFGVFKVSGVLGFGFPTFHPSQPLKIPRGEIEAGDSVEILPFFCGRYSKFTPACRIGVCCEELKVHPRTITCSGSNPIWAWVCRILKGEIEPGVFGHDWLRS